MHSDKGAHTVWSCFVSKGLEGGAFGGKKKLVLPGILNDIDEVAMLKE
jgi:hypothetical protein